MLESIGASFLSPTLNNPLVISFGLGLIRSVSGWLYHALEDNRITRYELKQLLHTFLRMIPQVLGWSAVGVPEVAFLSDMALSAVKKK